MQFAQRERRRHQQAPPYHRADPRQPHLDLQVRVGAQRGLLGVLSLHRLLRPQRHPDRLPPVSSSAPRTPEILMLSDPRLAKGFEVTIASAPAFLYTASAMLLLRRIARSA
jgi:hypothetical protein